MDAGETRNTTDLLTQPYMHPAVYVWHGMNLRGLTWEPVEAPVGGDSVALGVFDMRPLRELHGTADADDPRYVEIPGTAWGDYTGSDYDRSNARSILRDWPEHVVRVTGHHGFEALVLPMGADVPAELFDAILRLGDYPLYDEDDHSALCTELEQEDWTSWGRSDWRREIRKAAHADDRDDDVDELDDDAYVDELFALLAERHDVTWHAETAVGGYWTDFDHTAREAWSEIRRRRMSELEAWARDLAAPLPGQLCLL
jgi:hypothetical protein